MSAIFGVWQRSGAPVMAESLGAMEAVLAPYGRDGRGVFRAGPVAVGHFLEALTPESKHESSPQRWQELVVTADVRLDEREDLQRRLGVEPMEPGRTDAELIARAYEKWGEECPRHLVGDYAFAIWDAGRRRFFAARDHIGARPFYFTRSDAVFAFASDLRAVLAVPGWVARIDEAEVARALLCRMPNHYDNERTYFVGVEKLPFGCCLTVDERGLRVSRYWRPEDVAPVRLGSERDYAEALHDLVVRAVADRLRTEHPVGAHCSSGLDSSSVAVLTARARRAQGRSAPELFSWSPAPVDGHRGEDHRRIEAVCRQERIGPARYRTVDFQGLVEMVRVDPATRPQFTVDSERGVQRAAEELGVRLILSGWGGDDGVSFAGTGLLAERLRRGRWREVAETLEFPGRLLRPRAMWHLPRVVWRNGLLPLLGDRWTERWGGLYQGSPFARPEFLQRVQGRMAPILKAPQIVPDAQRFLFELYHRGLVTARMESWTGFGADHRVTYAYPLTDRRVLEFIYGSPVDLHHRQGRGRYLFRRAMRGRVLPAEYGPETQWKLDNSLDAMKGDFGYRQWAQRLADLEREGAWAQDWVDVDRLRVALAEGAQGRASVYGLMPAMNAVRMLMIFRHGERQGWTFPK